LLLIRTGLKRFAEIKVTKSARLRGEAARKQPRTCFREAIKKTGSRDYVSAVLATTLNATEIN